MARVPLARNLVQQQPVTDAKFRAFDTGAGAIAEGVKDFGRSMGKAAQEWENAKETQDEAGAKALINTAAERARNQLWTGDDAYFRKEGFDAVNARPQVDKFFTDMRAELGAAAKTPRQRQMFEDAFDRLHGQEAEGIARYEIGQLRTEETRQSAARMSNFQNDAIRFADDPGLFAENLQGGLIELRNQADKNGWAPETLQNAEREFVSKTHSSVAQGKLVTDIDGAKAYLETHRGELTWKDAAELDAALAKPLAERQSYVDADMLFGLASAPSGPGAVGATVSNGQAFDAIVKIEGGTDRNGRFLTSPKGAVGPAQVMPGTAREAAKLAGLPYDEKRFKGDAAYNLALGQAYYAKQLRDFGDPVMAAAAYNAGPGSAAAGTGLRGAMAKARAAGRPDSWADYLPKETRDYVKKFRTLANDPAVRQAPQRHDLNELLARADVVAEREGWSFERREQAKEEIERRVARDEKLVARQENEADREADELIINRREGFTSTNQIPRSVWANMSTAARASAMKTAEANRKPKEPDANSREAMTLGVMAIVEPDRFKSLNLGQFVGKVTRAELDSFLKDQAKLRVGGEDGKPVSIRSNITGTISFYTKSDKALSKALDQEKNPQAFMRVFKDMEGYVLSLTGGKRDPSDAELDAAWKRATMKVLVDGEETPRFETPVGGRSQIVMPIAVRERIRASWKRAHGNREPPDGVIGDIYIQHKGKAGFW